MLLPPIAIADADVSPFSISFIYFPLISDYAAYFALIISSIDYFR